METYCNVCGFSHTSSENLHLVTCAPTKPERLRKYAAFLKQNGCQYLSCFCPAYGFKEDYYGQVTPFANGAPRSCAICSVTYVAHNSDGMESILFYHWYPIIYYRCRRCIDGKERLFEDSFMTVAETRFLLLLTLRRVYPPLYLIRDLRRHLCGYIRGHCA